MERGSLVYTALWETIPGIGGRHSTLWDPKIFEQRKVMNVMGYEEREIAEVGHGGL